jgi:hypothetical protein
VGTHIKGDRGPPLPHPRIPSPIEHAEATHKDGTDPANGGLFAPFDSLEGAAIWLRLLFEHHQLASASVGFIGFPPTAPARTG